MQSDTNAIATFFWSQYRTYLLDYNIIFNKTKVAHIQRVRTGGHFNRYVLDFRLDTETKLDCRIGLAMVFIMSWPHFRQIQKKPWPIDYGVEGK